MTLAETPVQLMRQSIIGDGDTCHMRLGHQFHWYPQMRTGTQELITGTAFHAILEAEANKHFHGIGYDASTVAMKALVEGIEEATTGFAWRDGEEGTIEFAHKTALAMAELYIQNHCWWKEDHQLLGIEWNFDLPWINGWRAGGTLDLLLMDSNGWIVMVDYKGPRLKRKAGWERVRNTPQMAWYKHWLTEWWRQIYPLDNGGEMRPIRHIYDVVSWGTEISYRQFQPLVSEYEEAWVLQMAERYARLVDQGPNGLFIPNTNTHLCHHKWCDYFAVCEAGERLNNDL